MGIALTAGLFFSIVGLLLTIALLKMPAKKYTSEFRLFWLVSFGFSCGLVGVGMAFVILALLGLV